MARDSGRKVTLAELQQRDGKDLRFGGWRDWLLLVVAMPVALGGLYGGAMLAVGSESGGVLLSPAGGVVVAAVALIVGLCLGASSRARRWLRDRGEI